PVDLEIRSGTVPDGRQGRYINLGDWITYFTYAVFEGTHITLKKRISDGTLSGDVRITGGPAL
ncbi:MAG TPA: hypothetical protein PK735_15340, partial [Flavobacteriales bacterium]|nr:hypothetical protein [Flavobacteriales bacterium]